MLRAKFESAKQMATVATTFGPAAATTAATATATRDRGKLSRDGHSKNRKSPTKPKELKHFRIFSFQMRAANG